jgi:hypothetical protein
LIKTLSVLMLAVVLVGCASTETSEADPEFAALSLDDSCQTFLDASHNTQGYYYTMACGNMVGRKIAAEQNNEPYPAMFRRCFPGSQSYAAGSLEDTIQTYCAQDPARPLVHALDFHWAKSIQRDSFY